MDLQKFWQDNKTIILGVLYLISPIDIVPEGFLGPLGIFDDGLIATILVAMIGYKVLRSLSGKKPSTTPETTGQELSQKLGEVHVVESRDL